MIGLNILAQFVSDHQRLLLVFDALQPHAVVVMDDVGLAVELKQRLSACTVIHRAWHPDDAEFHLKWTPQSAADLPDSIPVKGVVEGTVTLTPSTDEEKDDKKKGS